MKHYRHAHAELPLRAQSICGAKARFPDMRNLPKPRWRDALAALAGPAMRLHGYRNLHKLTFYQAICQLDCKEKR
jgi:hypothetical protein